MGLVAEEQVALPSTQGTADYPRMLSELAKYGADRRGREPLTLAWAKTADAVTRPGGPIWRRLDGLRGATLEERLRWVQDMPVPHESTLEWRYFEGPPVLFPDVAESVGRLAKRWEGPLEWYNDTIASDFEEHPKRSHDDAGPDLFRLDAQVIRQQAQESLPDRIEYLVDGAKACTLRAMDDYDAASRVIEKHLD